MSTKRRSIRGKETRFGKRSVRRHSIRRPSVVSFEGQEAGEDEDFMQIYKEEEDVSSEEEIFENIKLQKEIIENIRCQPWRIRKKLHVLRLAKDYVEKYEGRLSRSHGYQEKGAKAIRRIKREFMNFIAIFIPWEMRVKKIESHYGSVVASYFVFLRWLVWINIWLAVLPIGFVMIPEIIAGKPYGSTDRKRIPDDAQADAYNLKTIWDAEGVVKYSMLFYGYYGNDEIIGAGYRLPLAYFLTGIGLFAFSFIMVLRQMATNARQSRLSSKDEQFTFAWKLYTSWDFMIGNTETANQKFASIATTFRESILEEKEKTKKENKKLIIFLRILANILVCISLGLSTWAIQICVDRSRENDLKKRRENYEMTFWEENEVTVIMTLITILFPSLFDLIALMEKYHPRVNLRWQLGRIFALNLLNIYTLFIALYWKQQDLTKEIERQLKNGTTTELRNVTYACLEDLTTVTLVPETGENIMNSSALSWLVSDTSDGNFTGSLNCTRVEKVTVKQQVDSDLCWESIIGQEVVKLTILDMVFTAINILIVDFLRGLCVRYTNICCCWDLEKQFPEYGEFKTAENILHLINNQGMIWLGTFFCPGLPVMNLIKLLLLLYLRNWAVMVCNVPQDRIFRASRSNNFYFAMLLVMLFLCTLPVAYAMVLMKPSPNCGPFSGLNSTMDVIANTMEKEFSDEVNTVLGYIASPAFIIPLFLLLSLGIYYLIALSRALREANNDLKMQLEYERTDGRKKVYAMAAIRDGDGEGGQGGGANGRKGFDIAKSEGGKGGKSGKRMAGAVASVLAATRMAKMLSSTNTPPVAVVRGKPSYPRRVPPSVPPRPRRPLPGNPQTTRPSIHNIASQLMHGNGVSNNRDQPSGRRSLRDLATRARSNARNEQRQAHTSRGGDQRMVNVAVASQNLDGGGSNRRTPRVRTRQQQQDGGARRRRNVQRYDARGNQFVGDFTEDEDPPEDEFSRYASDDAQQSQRLLHAGRSVDSGIQFENDENVRRNNSSRRQNRRRYLSVEDSDEGTDEEDDTGSDEEGEANDEEGNVYNNTAYNDDPEEEDPGESPVPGERSNTAIMSDPSLHTNAVYEEDINSDDSDESQEGVLSASGHLIPKIRVTDHSDDRGSSGDVVIDINNPAVHADANVNLASGNTSEVLNNSQQGSSAKRGNWRQRQRHAETLPEDVVSSEQTAGDDYSGRPRSSGIGVLKALSRFQRAGRPRHRQTEDQRV